MSQSVRLCVYSIVAGTRFKGVAQFFVLVFAFYTSTNHMANTLSFASLLTGKKSRTIKMIALHFLQQSSHCLRCVQVVGRVGFEPTAKGL